MAIRIVCRAEGPRPEATYPTTILGAKPTIIFHTQAIFTSPDRVVVQTLRATYVVLRCWL